ncbi:MAG: Peptide methionine sulfoxide reductase MsrA 1 [Polaribacter sp. SA4-10]|nr:MAG: Peptide methionine sulfoxide reductase MsrA 1 [Polaribacter sp. SA4-10]|tara:strand:- start:4 stop:633 length:630 start_codon:yes stop_codon:yes gene_type:complete
MKFIKRGVIIGFLTLLFVCFSFIEKNETVQYESNKEIKVAYFASGCFWCVEAVFESLHGVEEAVSGYAGGHTNNPTYQSTGSGKTGHAETVAVYYNPKKISFKTLVTVYFGSHNPTTVNGQKPDFGSQYRSIAFYKTDLQRKIIINAITELSKIYNNKIATEVTKFTKFYIAEDYHQNFERRNPNHPYVRSVSIPRLNNFKRKFPELLK